MKKSESKRHKHFFEFYGLNSSVESLITREKNYILKNLYCGPEIINDLHKIADSSKFIVDIPKDLLKMLRNGEAKFDKSSKIIGDFTPNIRKVGEKGIVGQATIREACDRDVLYNSLANLSSMTMVLSLADQLQTIDEKIDELKQGQESQLLGEVLGAFSEAVSVYSTGVLDNMRLAFAIGSLQKGLTTLLADINNRWGHLMTGPKSYLEVASYLFRYPTQLRMVHFEKKYNEFIEKIQWYFHFLFLHDLVIGCFAKDKDGIIPNHKLLYDFLTDRLDNDFVYSMGLINDSAEDELPLLLDQSKLMYQKALDYTKADVIAIDLDEKDIKLLNNSEYEER